MPVVLLDRDTVAYPRRTGHDLVGLDNRRAGYLATEHLLRLGRQRVAFVAPPDVAASVDARIAGYREALFMEDAPMETALVRRLDPGNVLAVRAMLEEFRPDAVICSSDRAAGRLMHALLALGRKLPEDVALVGIDDAGYASLLPVPLTTVRQPCREIGAAAVAAMLERVSRPQAAPRRHSARRHAGGADFVRGGAAAGSLELPAVSFTPPLPPPRAGALPSPSSRGRRR